MKLTLSLISIEFYCIPRMLNSIELLVLFMVGLCLALLVERAIKKFALINLSKIILPILSMSIVFTTVGYIKVNINKILKYHNNGDGVIREGYSLMPIEENDKMIPNIFLEIGYYFDSLPSQKYTVYSPEYLSYNGLKYTNQYLLFSSKKIENARPDWNVYEYAVKYNDYKTANKIKLQNAAWGAFHDFLHKRSYVKSYSNLNTYLEKGSLNYAIFTDQKIVNYLLQKNWKLKAGSKSKGFWIIKRE